MSIRLFAKLLIPVVLLLFPSQTFAHSFGWTYTLPLPLWIFAYGGGAAVIISFLIISYLVRQDKLESTSPDIDITSKGLTFATKNWFIKLGKVTSVILLAIAIISGILGGSNYTNINMPLFWIIFILGFTYLVAIIGDIYSTINPVKIAVEWLEKIFKLKLEPIYSYPLWLGYYPALLLYFIFIYIELFSGTSPYELSLLLLQYIIISFAGVIFWGKNIWFKYCDFFNVFFDIVGKASILTKRDRRIYFRMPFSGLLKEKAESLSHVMFILFMLSSTAFDGFHATRAFYYLRAWVKLIPLNTFSTLMLALSPLLFFVIYLILIWLTKVITRSADTLKKLTLHFAFSLVPIALVYNIAHYYVLLITEGQGFLRALSDPLGYGWNLFGTAELVTNLAWVDTVTTWYIQVGLILIGHIAGVYIAHVNALKLFPNNRRAILSQLPMLILMVLYTVAGLWILAQPITSGGLL